MRKKLKNNFNNTRTDKNGHFKKYNKILEKALEKG